MAEGESVFVQGASLAIAVCVGLENHGMEGTARKLAGAVVQMMNGYYDQLIRSSNRQDTEIQVLEHCKEFMPKTLYPGDMRAEQEPLG